MTNASAASANKLGLTVGEASAVFALTIAAAGETTDGPSLFIEYAALWRELAEDFNVYESNHETST